MWLNQTETWKRDIWYFGILYDQRFVAYSIVTLICKLKNDVWVELEQRNSKISKHKKPQMKENNYDNGVDDDYEHWTVIGMSMNPLSPIILFVENYNTVQEG